MNQRSFFTFTLGESHFGVDVLHVREVIRRFDWTPVERAPVGAVGLLNLRGQIVPLVDLAPRLGVADGQNDAAETCCVILKTGDELSHPGAPPLPLRETVGLMVHQIGEVFESGRESLESPPANLGEAGRSLEGVIRLDGRLIMILDLRQTSLFTF